MKQKKEELEANRKRYRKSKSIYNTFNNGQTIAFLSLTSLLTVGSTVLTSGMAVPFFLITTFSGLSLVAIACSGATTKVVKNKKNKLKKKIFNLDSLLAKMEVFIEKAKEDGTITPQEIAQFNKLLEKKTAVTAN